MIKNIYDNKLDYRGEIGVILYNTHKSSFVVYNGDRIAQAMIRPIYQIEFESVERHEDLPSSERGKGGFGSTGI